MVSWQQFTTEAPDLAARVARRFSAHKHKTMATLRADGSPRLCGTEVEIVAGQLWLGGMTGNRRFVDLRRDPRLAVHSGSDEPDVWSGDARVIGLGVEITDPAEHDAYRAGLETEVPPGPFELFQVDLTEAMVVRLDDAKEALIIESWRPGEPVRSVTRR
jgi:hypothetical protein